MKKTNNTKELSNTEKALALVSQAAKLMNLTILETMDLFVKLKIKSNLTMEDYIESCRNIKSWSIFKKK